MKHTWLGQGLRRLGRIGIGFIAFLVGCLAFIVASVVSVLVTNLWFWQISGLAGLGAAIGVFRLFDALDLVPDDSDPPTALSLKEYPAPEPDRPERHP
jgi:hypothetical protein